MLGKRIVSAVLAASLAVGSAAFTTSAAETSTEEVLLASTSETTYNAGIAFQTNSTWNYRNAYGSDNAVCSFPNKGIGVQGGAYGIDTDAEINDTTISGDGSYTVSIATSGTIDEAGDGGTKFYLNDDKTLSRQGSSWSMLKNSEPSNDNSSDVTQDTMEWTDGKTTDKFNMLLITTDIPCEWKESSDGSSVPYVNGKEVTVTNISVDFCGTKGAGTSKIAYKDDEDYLTISIINAYGDSSIDSTLMPTTDGTITATFDISGLDSEDTQTDISTCKVSGIKSSYAYTGKAIKPTVTVKNGSTKLTKGTDYTVSYSSNKKTGKAKVVIKGKGNYTGKITKYFYIVPKKVSSVKLTSTKTKQIKVKWKKDTQASGYQIFYSTNSKFKNKKFVTVTKNTTVAKTIKSLKKGKTYYVKVRAYKTVNGVKKYGKCSAVKKIKCK